MSASLAALLSSWSAEFSARASRVRSLIGENHWLSDGTHKERLLQSFLSARVPKTVAVDHGFLLNPSRDDCSREVDVLLRDCLHSAPLFDESGITICHPESAIGYIEAKSTIGANSFGAALELISNTQRLISTCANPRKVWRGVYFAHAESDRTDESLFEMLVGKIVQVCDSIGHDPNECSVNLPNCIVCLDRFCAFIDAGRAGGRSRLRYFALKDLSFAVGMADLLSHVYERASVRGIQPLDEGVERVVTVTPLVKEV